MKAIFFNLYVLSVVMIVFIDKSYAQDTPPSIIDEIPYNYDVNPNGAFTYQVPLRLPPGIKNIVPNLAVTYNSQSGMGLLGMGWTLTGLSSITRTQPSLYHNSDLHPVNFDNADIYSLDGQPLYKVEDQSSSIYYTWIKNYSRIIASGTFGSGPDHWIVETSEGLVFEYGNSSSSKVLNNSGTEVLTWNVNKITDKNGNYVTFEYNNTWSIGTNVVSKILYNANSVTSLSPKTEINFQYVSRINGNRTWMKDLEIREQTILKAISINHNSVNVNQYIFDYIVNKDLHLTKIREIRNGIDELPHININWWDNDLSDFDVATTTSQFSSQSGLALGDFNGDGATDFTATPAINTGPLMPFDLYTNNKSDDFNKITIFPTAGPIFASGIVGSYTQSSNKLMVDYNGDGFDDMLMVCRGQTVGIGNGLREFILINCFLSDGVGGFSPGVTIFKYDNGGNIRVDYVDHVRFLLGDFDGDGKKDILAVVPNSMKQWVTSGPWDGMYYDTYLIRHSNVTSNSAACGLDGWVLGNYEWSGTLHHDVQAAMALDFNGDNKDDFLITSKDYNVTHTDCMIYNIVTNYSNTCNNVVPNITTNSGQPYLLAVSDYPSVDHTVIKTGDFNGDGKTDLLTWVDNGMGYGNWEVRYSKGYGNPFPSTLQPFQNIPGSIPASSLGLMLNGYEPLSSFDNSIHIADFNGDGKDDILKLNRPSSSSTDIGFQVCYSVAYNCFEAPVGGTLQNFYMADENKYSIGDFNGDGQADLLWHLNGSPGINPKIVYFNKNDLRNTVNSIEHAHKLIQVDIKPLSQIPYTYSIPTSTIAGKPYFTRQIPLKVVTSLKIITGTNNNIENWLESLHNTYSYNTLTFNRLGLGVLGFRKMLVTNLTSNKVTENTYYNYDDFSSPTPFLEHSYTWDLTSFTTLPPSSLVPIRFTEQTYHNIDGGCNGKVRIVLPIYSHTIDNASGTETSKTSIMNTSSLMTGGVYYEFGKCDKTIELSGPITTTTDYTFDLTQAFHNRNKPITIATSIQRAGKTPYVRKSNFKYYSNGLLEKLVTDPGTPRENTTTYLYDSYGNLGTSTLIATGISTPFTDWYFYSADGRFKIRHINPLGYIEEDTHNDWGAVLTHTGINGLITYYQYDPVNRIKQVTSTTGDITYTNYDWAEASTDNPSPSGTAQFSTRTTKNGISGESLSFSDYFDRTVREVSMSFDGNKLYKDTKYRLNGNLESTTEPYFSTSTPSSVTTYYQNDWDQLTSLTNSAGGPSISTQFTLTSSGLETKVTNTSTGQNKTTYTDKSGATWKINDNGNVIEFDYNSNGNVDVQKLVNSTTYQTVNQYDNFSQLIEKSEPNAGITKYEYNSLGQLKKKIDANSKEFTYTYDILGRIIESTEQTTLPAAPATLTYYYSYDNTPGIGSTGKLIMAISPYGNSIANTYDFWGRLVQVDGQITTSPSQLFTSKYSFDIYGREVTYTTPSGDVIQNNYNSYGFLESKDIIDPNNVNPPLKLWKINSQNNLGQTTQSTYYKHSGTSSIPLYQSVRNYTNLGLPTSREVNNILSTPISLVNTIYSVNPVNGNFDSRRDNIRGIQENFTYDLSFDRLLTSSISGTTGATNLTMTYDAVGNILTKNDASTSSYNWLYDAFSLRTVPEPATTGLIPTTYNQEETYYAFKKVKSIEENNEKYDFVYWPDEQRTKMTITNTSTNTLLRTHFYASNFEKIIDASTNNTTEINYVFGENEPVALIIHKTGSPTQVYYPMVDVQGSITHIFDNQGVTNNGLVEERSFDPWGRPRDPNNWHYYSSSSPMPNWLINRGYTGHEHLNNVNIINMNGRLYDPLVGRMLTTDPVISDATNSQAYNKYSYVNNNPLKYTDPSGNNPAAILMAAAIGGTINVLTHQKNISNIQQGAGYFFVGALSGAAGGYIGSISGTALSMGGGFAAGFFSGAAGGFVGGFINGAGNAALQGLDIDMVLQSGSISGCVAAITSGVISGIGYGIHHMRIESAKRSVQEDIAKLQQDDVVDGGGKKIAEWKGYEAYIQSKPGLRRMRSFLPRNKYIISETFVGRHLTGNNFSTDKLGYHGIPGVTGLLNDGSNKWGGVIFTYMDSYVPLNMAEIHVYIAIEHELSHAIDYFDGSIARWTILSGSKKYALARSEVKAYGYTYQSATQYNYRIWSMYYRAAFENMIIIKGYEFNFLQLGFIVP